MKVLLVDDHVLFRQGLKFLLSDLSKDIEFFEADNCHDVAAVIDGHEIDIALLDLYMADSNGLDGLRKVRGLLSSATIVVLSSEDNPHVIRSAIDQGASGFIPKSSTQDVMIAALRLVLVGGVYLPSHALLNLRNQSPGDDEHSRKESASEQLTERQREVLARAVQGKANKIIARELDITEATVKAHLSACFRVLEVKNRTEAVFAAANAGLTI